MTMLKIVSEKKAKGKVKKIYYEIKKIRKITKIPNFWKTIANDPDTLERTWNSLQQVMKKGSLDPNRLPDSNQDHTVSSDVDITKNAERQNTDNNVDK